MADDIDAKIPPNTREMLDQTSKEGVERSRRISSLSSRVVEMEKQATLDTNKMSNEISKISKKQRVVREELKGIKDSTIPEIEAMAPAVNKILLHISGAVGSLATGMKRITIDTATSAKNVVGQYGKAVSEDISINRENLMAMSLAKATPIFGYFAAKFMQTDVFKSAAAKIKQTFSSAISSVGGGLKNISSAAASKVQNLFSKGVKEPPPKMQTGGYVEKGGVAEVHPAEVIVPIDKVLSKFSEQQKGKGGDVQEQTLTTLKDLSTNMKMYGNYFQKEKMNRKGVIKDFVTGIWGGKYGKSWEFRMLMATEKLQAAISETPGRFKFAWESIMWKHPIFRKLIGLTKGLWSTSKMFGRMIRWPFKLLFAAKGKYTKDIKQATSTDNAMGQIANILAAIHTRLMPRMDTLIRNTGALNNFVLQESGYEKQESGTSRLISRVFKMLTPGKKKELSMGKKSNLLPGPDQMANDIRLIEENTRSTSKKVKLLAPLQKDQIIELKKTRRSISWMGKGVTKLGKTLKSSGQFIWKLLMMGFAFIQPLLTSVSSLIGRWLPAIATGIFSLGSGLLGKAFGGIGKVAGGLLGATGATIAGWSLAAVGAGAAGYGIGTLINKVIDKAFGEKGGLGKWVYDKVHEQGDSWYKVAWGFIKLPFTAVHSLWTKVKEWVYERIEGSWVFNKVKQIGAIITYPYKLAWKIVKKLSAFGTWLGESTKTIYRGVSASIKFIWNLPGNIVDFVTWPFRKVSSLLSRLKQWTKLKLSSIPIIGRWFQAGDDSWLAKEKLFEKLKKEEGPSFIEKISSFLIWPLKKIGELKDTFKQKISEKWDNILKDLNSVKEKISSFLSWPFTKIIELKDTFKQKIHEKWDNIIKDLNVKIDNIVDLITWPIRKMVELVTKAKDWTMEKLQNIPLIGRIMKWSKEKEKEDGQGLEPIVKPKEDKPSWWKSLKKAAGMAKGGITTRSTLANLHASEAVIPLPPEVTEAITKRFIDRSEIAKRDVASRMAESKYAAGEFGKKTGDIASQIEKGQVQINNAMVYNSNLMANSNSNMASTIADSMGSGGGSFSSGNDFAAQVLKCNLS